MYYSAVPNQCLNGVSILLVEDEPHWSTPLKKALLATGAYVEHAESSHKAIRMLDKNWDVVVLDLNLENESPADGMSVLEAANARFRDRQEGDLGWYLTDPFFIVSTTNQRNKEVLNALEQGARAYVPKTAKDQASNASIVIRQIMLHVDEIRRIKNLRMLQQIKRDELQGMIIGESQAIIKLTQTITRIASTDSTVLITGETGTGKELVARSIHQQSKRANKIFTAINCAAFSESLVESELFGHEKGAFSGAICQRHGKFEYSNEGTIFLDEIGDITLNTQAKVLRVLQEKQFERVGGNESINTDVRIIAATNKNLEEMVKKGTFREDLYYRLKVIHIRTPPLRERKTDIPLLTDHFILKHSIGVGKHIEGITSEVQNWLQNHPWPGNVRELTNTIERAVVLTKGHMITLDCLSIDSSGFNTSNTSTEVVLQRFLTADPVKKTTSIEDDQAVMMAIRDMLTLTEGGQRRLPRIDEDEDSRQLVLKALVFLCDRNRWKTTKIANEFKSLGGWDTANKRTIGNWIILGRQLMAALDCKKCDFNSQDDLSEQVSRIIECLRVNSEEFVQVEIKKDDSEAGHLCEAIYKSFQRLSDESEQLVPELFDIFTELSPDSDLSERVKHVLTAYENCGVS
ncbi:Nitrogen fixation protein VnfA [Gimesia maris]|uniref:sigma-54-dependent transcriptional regulator n=1 Tax=Gimesia maris TaxID=122 RepID=UPI001187F7AD|nr:sigma-54 dependent transcriptional regulator [Gimesia maris]QDT78248.1 Nitrogen fixation protein VnfA [Gimesia maris]